MHNRGCICILSILLILNWTIRPQPAFDDIHVVNPPFRDTDTYFWFHGNPDQPFEKGDLHRSEGKQIDEEKIR